MVPTAITGLEIDKITLKRDGVAVDSIGGDFGPTEFGRPGAKPLRMGDVLFPISAFRPEGEVVVTLIPSSGTSIVKTIDQKSLRSIQ